mmetsp:Transcript_15192/g.33248  ORF Transcript_15192/g.33248 Transcript_15192/m.33248 type:complete len:236 (+) Transcript_15192:475-1182(+)
MRGRLIMPSSFSTDPQTRASYFRSILRVRKTAFIPRTASMLLANTTNPDVSMPSRWTTIMSGRPISHPKDSQTASARLAAPSLPLTHKTPAGLSTTIMCSSSNTTLISSLLSFGDLLSFSRSFASWASSLALMSALLRAPVDGAATPFASASSTTGAASTAVSSTVEKRAACAGPHELCVGANAETPTNDEAKNVAANPNLMLLVVVLCIGRPVSYWYECCWSESFGCDGLFSVL